MKPVVIHLTQESGTWNAALDRALILPFPEGPRRWQLAYDDGHMTLWARSESDRLTLVLEATPPEPPPPQATALQRRAAA